jgi:hypothetical protein
MVSYRKTLLKLHRLCQMFLTIVTMNSVTFRDDNVQTGANGQFRRTCYEATCSNVSTLLCQITRCTSRRIEILSWGADKSLARPTSRCILFDCENISFDASLVIYINSTNIPPIIIINRIYEHENLLSL